jgi:phage host-nuclease inhibitor protein Gam
MLETSFVPDRVVAGGSRVTAVCACVRALMVAGGSRVTAVCACVPDRVVAGGSRVTAVCVCLIVWWLEARESPPSVRVRALNVVSVRLSYASTSK